MPARSVLPDWLRRMPAKAHSEIHGREIRTVKQSPPFIGGKQHGREQVAQHRLVGFMREALLAKLFAPPHAAPR
jgi:hypothetical protein